MALHGTFMSKAGRMSHNLSTPSTSGAHGEGGNVRGRKYYGECLATPAALKLFARLHGVLWGTYSCLDVLVGGGM